MGKRYTDAADTIELLCTKAGQGVCADDDGVVVVPGAEAAWALRRAEARLADVVGKRHLLAGGELGLDMYGLRDTLDALGVRYL